MVVRVSRRSLRFALCLLCAAVLAACGGGLGETPVANDGATTTVSGTGDMTTTAVSDADVADFGDAVLSTDTADTADSTDASAAAVTDDGTDAMKALAAAMAPPGSIAPPGGTSTNLAVAVNMSMLPAKATGASHDQVLTTGEMPMSGVSVGSFRTTCTLSHMAKDDPIVYPNQPGASHLHSFFGNTGANATSTAASIAGSGNSTCRGGTVNRTAYWVPTMIDTKSGAPVRPTSAMIYYKTGYNGIKPYQVKPFPAGLRMIAGDPKNTRPSGPFQYKCVGNGADKLVGMNIQNCPAGSELWTVVMFPQCWDGRNLDSPDHKSHMSYTVRHACPATHPVPLPEVTFNIRYKVTETNAPLRWRLSSDAYDRALPAGYSSHGDWFNGWKQDVMKTWVQRCDVASKDCHAHLLGDGRALY